MRRLRSIGKDSIASIVLLSALLASSSAQAHIVLLDPPARTPDTGLFMAPCGGKPMGASVATYLAGTDIEITFNLLVPHNENTHVYISYDDFATRTELAMMPTPEVGVYTMTVPLPVHSLGPAVLQLNHQNYYSCADITLEDGAEFALNAGLNDAWYYKPTDGQGFFITVFPDLRLVSLAWFTYDTELPPEGATANLGDPGHRWITAAGTYIDNQAVLEVVLVSGGLFDTPGEVQRTDPPGSDGTIILTFDSCNSGTVEYDIPSIDRQGIIPIERVANDNIVICEALQ